MFLLRCLDINVGIVMFHKVTAFGILVEEKYLEAQKLSLSLYVFAKCCRNQCFKIVCV